MTVVKCPFCGSNNLASFIYGLVLGNEELDRDLKEEKVVLGGCVVMKSNPKFRCNKCKKRFGGTPETENFQDLVEQIKAISFYVDGFATGCSHLEFFPEKDGIYYRAFTGSALLFKKDDHTEIFPVAPKAWDDLKQKLYGSLFLNDWEKEYVDQDILDGTQWELKIQFENGEEKECYGSNAYPIYWDELLDLLKPFFKKAGYPLEI